MSDDLIVRAHAWRAGISNDVTNVGDLRQFLTEVIAALAAQQNSPSAEDLHEMEVRKDAAYLERNQVVAALTKVFPSGKATTAIEGWSEDWHGCAYIDLPTGQASWHYHDSHAYLFAHLPPYTKDWDGHTTEQKYARLAALTKVSPSALGGLSEEEVGEIERRAEKATVGPWANEDDINPDHITRGRDKDGAYLYVAHVGWGTNDDAIFIAHARTDIPKLIAALRSASRQGKS